MFFINNAVTSEIFIFLRHHYNGKKSPVKSLNTQLKEVGTLNKTDDCIYDINVTMKKI